MSLKLIEMTPKITIQEKKETPDLIYPPPTSVKAFRGTENSEDYHWRVKISLTSGHY